MVKTAPIGIATMGIDVAIERGLDVVGLDNSLDVVLGPEKVQLIDLPYLIRQTEPQVIAIDSPPRWGTSGNSRQLERQLQGLGISIFPTPAVAFVRELHRWMEIGFSVFRVAAELGYQLYTGGPPSARSAIEVFPHASAVVLRGSLAPTGVPKNVWRRSVLEGVGVTCSAMRTTDQLDATLAALTGLRFLRGDFSVVGTPGEAVLVLPIKPTPTVRYQRDNGATFSPASGLHHARRPRVDGGNQECGCGCGATVRRQYLPGHDAKHRSRLLAEMRAGDHDAAAALERLGWSPIQDRRLLVDGSNQECGCGCGATVRRRYLPGHDAKHRSKLLAELRAGDREAGDELERLGWSPIHVAAQPVPFR